MSEINFDGLIGPTHNYSGLSEGNNASKKNYSSKSNNKKELLKYKEEVKEVLENEIVSRYYYQEGRVINSFKYDPAVKEAIKILNDKIHYNKILNN